MALEVNGPGPGALELRLRCCRGKTEEQDGATPSVFPFRGRRAESPLEPTCLFGWSELSEVIKLCNN